LKKLVVRVKTRQPTNEVVGFDSEGTLLVKVTAPPSAGRANACLIELVARALGVPKSSVSIKSGARSTRKILVVPESSSFPSATTPATKRRT
jgi:uncharacterized protein YggU (UPF0235/DUF167 family)